MKSIETLILVGAILLHGNAAQMYRTRNVVPFPLRLYQRSTMYYQPNMMYVPPMSTDTLTGYMEPQPQPGSQQDKTCLNCNNIPEEPLPASDYEVTTKGSKVDSESLPEEEQGLALATQIPILEEATSRGTKTKHLPPQEDEDYEDWPLKKKWRTNPSQDVFFPIMFGFSRPGNTGQGLPGATAIANAFSSGKGGVASSHATAYGNAPLRAD